MYIYDEFNATKSTCVKYENVIDMVFDEENNVWVAKKN